MELYEYAVFKQPKYDKDGDTTEQGEILVKPTTILASSPKNAELIAARAIPEGKIGDDLDRITVAVRPF